MVGGEPEPTCGLELAPGLPCALPANIPHIEHMTGDGGCKWKSVRTTVEAAQAVMGGK
jgi:hypothetical protein